MLQSVRDHSTVEEIMFRAVWNGAVLAESSHTVKVEGNHSDRGVLVGATSAGPVGGEVLSALVVAVHGQVPAADLQTMIYAYPIFHRAIEAALDDLASG
jgi:pyruvate/2-oxoglutarate dehydrogenase complex dihydrolipoamide dehydrogenase (E3) component